MHLDLIVVLPHVLLHQHLVFLASHALISDLHFVACALTLQCLLDLDFVDGALLQIPLL
jgi:hypothetical protein